MVWGSRMPATRSPALPSRPLGSAKFLVLTIFVVLAMPSTPASAILRTTLDDCTTTELQSIRALTGAQSQARLAASRLTTRGHRSARWALSLNGGR